MNHTIAIKVFIHDVVNTLHISVNTAILSRILAQACVTPLSELCREGLRMIVLVSLRVLLRERLVSTIFRMVHPYIAIHLVE